MVVDVGSLFVLMFGCIVVILVVLGMWVVCGVLLLVFEVMKMEYIL